MRSKAEKTYATFQKRKMRQLLDLSGSPGLREIDWITENPSAQFYTASIHPLEVSIPVFYGPELDQAIYTDYITYRRGCAAAPSSTDSV